jgi:hypothetical protein
MLIAITYLERTPPLQYDNKVTRDGEFETFEDFTKWIKTLCAPVDLRAEYRPQYRAIKQQDDESINDYYLH